MIASDRRRRLAFELGIVAEGTGSSDLFDPAQAKLEERKAAATRARAHLHEVEMGALEAQAARDEAARERDELAGQIKLLRRRQDTLVRHPEALGPASAGRCNVPLQIARERGCPLVEQTSLPVAVDRRAEPSLDIEIDMAALTEAHAEAERRAEELRASLARWTGSLAGARATFTETEASLRAVERLVEELRSAEDDVEEVTRESALRASRMDAVTDQRSALRKAHAAARERLSDRFQSILQALLGDQISGEVALTRDGIDPVVRERGDRESSAMDTVKVIAFDLAALTLGFEGHGHFPGFLVHDGPREADMDQAIYDRLFLYAREMEEAFPSASIGFQYIVTTTTPPPASVRKAPWLIDPVLDASTPEGRLLGMDL